ILELGKSIPVFFLDLLDGFLGLANLILIELELLLHAFILQECGQAALARSTELTSLALSALAPLTLLGQDRTAQQQHQAEGQNETAHTPHNESSTARDTEVNCPVARRSHRSGQAWKQGPRP